MTTTYMFDKSNRTNIMSMQRQAITIIQSFFYSFSKASPFLAPQYYYKSLTLNWGVGQQLTESGLTPETVGRANTKDIMNQSLVGKPVFTVSPDKVIIQLFYYSPSMDITNSSITALGDALTRCWGRTVELRLIRLNHSALDSSIFAQYLTANSSKYGFNRIMDMLNSNLPTVVSEGSIDETSVVPASHITGVKVKLSGRLTTQRSGPRQTVKAGRIGSSAKGQFGTVDYSQHTAKNKLGAFTMKVWISQQSR